MIGTEQTLFGPVNLVDDTIALLKKYEPPDGYYLAFSGGKDSLVLKNLCDKAGVKYDAHYNMTTVDPPELVKYIRRDHPDVIFDRPKMSMFQLIVHKKTPPTRRMRYCCEYLKEHGGDGRIKLIGIRREESASRARRNIVEGNLISPILLWTEFDVWEYIDFHKLQYCELYDTGSRRLGCIMCPLQTTKGMENDAKLYPKYYRAYMNAFEKVIIRRSESNMETMSYWRNAQDIMNWWIYDSKGDGGLYDILD